MTHEEYDQKCRDINAILKNETYMEDSGLMRNLVKALSRVSKSNLVNLDLIIKLKCNEAKSERFHEGVEHD